MIHILAVTYGHTTELDVFLGSFIMQSRQDWMLQLWHDGEPPSQVKAIIKRYSKDKQISLMHTEEHNGKWGHISRRISLERLQGSPTEDFVLLTNADNYYVPTFIEQMQDAIKSHEKMGIVYCDTIHSHLKYGYHQSRLHEGGLDMGCAIVRLDIAKSIGFVHEHFSADGRYLADCSKAAATAGLAARHINRGLFIHN